MSANKITTCFPLCCCCYYYSKSDWYPKK